MIRLQGADLEAPLTFLGDVVELEFDEAYPVEVVDRLQDVVRCDALTYQDLDLHAERFCVMFGIGPTTTSCTGPSGRSRSRTTAPERAPCAR